MTAEDYIYGFIALFVTQVPVVVVATIGLWFAISRGPTLGKAGLLAKWGFGMLIAHAFLSATLRVALLGLRAELAGQTINEISAALFWHNIISLCAYPLFIGGLALLARAVFVGHMSDAKRPTNAGGIADAA